MGFLKPQDLLECIPGAKCPKCLKEEYLNNPYSTDNITLNNDNLYLANPYLFKTYTGILFDFNDFTEDMISFDDICWGLCREPRCRGHCNINYYVMIHSLLVSYLVPQTGTIPARALLHDGEEYIFGDWPKQLKALPEMNPLKIKANKLRNMIYNKYIPGVCVDLDAEVLPEVKEADNLAYLIERDWFKHKDQKVTSNYNLPIYSDTYTIIEYFNIIKSILCFKGNDHALIQRFIERAKEVGINVNADKKFDKKNNPIG
jgi:hypothetical protein